MTSKRKDFLFDLLNAYSPSGYETEASYVFREELSNNDVKIEFIDNIGNSAFSVGKDGGIPFMLSGHIDEIALQVQYIDDNGFLHFIKDGGVDPKTVVGRKVVIHTSNKGDVMGVIGKAPIHIEFHTEANDKVTKLEDLKIDIGADNLEESLSMGVNVGDTITFLHSVHFLGLNRIASGSIDDKVGVYITAEVLKRLKADEKTHPLKMLKVYGVACTQEEIGGHGATLAAKRINPRYSIDYDVTFATDDGCVKKEEWGDIKLGKGGCIAFGPDKNNSMIDLMRNVCTNAGIPYQSFAVGAGMTNTLKIKLAADNCETMLLSIPERNMHTQVEVCDLRDLDSMVEMTYRFIKTLDNKLSYNGM